MDEYRIGILSHPILGLSYRIVSAAFVWGGEEPDIMCITASIKQDDQRAFVPCDPVHAREGLEGREEEGDCNLIPASLRHQDGAVLGLGHQRRLTPSTSRK